LFVVEMSATVRSGLAYGLAAYLLWGLIPIYFRQLREVAPLEILAQRVLWSVVFLGLIVALFGGAADIRRVLRSRKLVATLALSASLLAVNWLLYIYASVNDRVTEAGLGYYVLPLVNAFLATVFLGEKLRPAHYPALALVAVGVVVPMVLTGSGWLAVALAVSFGFYGLVRKRVPVESFTGLAIETLLMLPPSLLYVGYAARTGSLNLGGDATVTALLVGCGVVTIVPLLTYTISLRRLPLLAVTCIQVISPTMQFLVAILWNGERPGWPMWFALGCVWAAVALFLADALSRARRPSAALPASVARPGPRLLR
jgi:chloramphenicol-sensitive protein RarD